MSVIHTSLWHQNVCMGHLNTYHISLRNYHCVVCSHNLMLVYVREKKITATTLTKVMAVVTPHPGATQQILRNVLIYAIFLCVQVRICHLHVSIQNLRSIENAAFRQRSFLKHMLKFVLNCNKRHLNENVCYTKGITRNHNHHCDIICYLRLWVQIKIYFNNISDFI